MSRAPRLAPSSLPRQQRRRVDRELYKLICREACSFCGTPLEHNTPTASGFDKQGAVAHAGVCCFDRFGEIFSEIFAMGFFSARRYDILDTRGSTSGTVPEFSLEQAAARIAAYQKTIADVDKRFGDADRRGGVRSTHINVLDYPWTADDRDWFKRNPKRSHRMRTPFPGELDKVKIPTGREVIVLVRQVEPGSRIRGVLHFGPDSLLPLPVNESSDEAIAHALFEVATRREAAPPDVQALVALVEKYKVPQGAGS